jgi:ABC-type branched-subunit amino acid transport system ATPase component
MSTPILEIKDLSKSFGGLKVIQGLDLSVAPGEVLSVIGPNGAGKTTLFNIISGIYPPDSGEILLDGTSIVGSSPEQIAGLGIARTFQTLRVFLNMTVRENVMAATYGATKARMWQSALRTPKARREERETRELAEAKLSFFGERLVGYRWDQPAYSLSYANRRRLEIARAMATNPRLLMLDEPAAGMNPREATALIGLIRKIAQQRTVLLIEHNMAVVMQIADRVAVLDAGRRIALGTPKEVADDPVVKEAYLGKRHANVG